MTYMAFLPVLRRSRRGRSPVPVPAAPRCSSGGGTVNGMARGDTAQRRRYPISARAHPSPVEGATMAEPGTGPDPLRDRIIDAALAVAEADAGGGGWYDLRVHLVARRLGVPLEAVLERFRDADAIADAWFARALRAIVRRARAGLRRLAAERARARRADALVRRSGGAPPRCRQHDPGQAAPVAPAPLGADGLQPVAPDPLGAGGGAAGRARRAAAGGGGRADPGVPPRALRVWLGDASPGQRRTRAFLRRNLGWLDRLPRRPAPDHRRRNG